MVLILYNVLILCVFAPELDGARIMVFERNLSTDHADRYQVAQHQAEGQALQGE